MSIISQLRSEIKSHLIVTDEVIERVGSTIHVGEKFKVRFVIGNTFPIINDGGIYNSRRYATYTNIKMAVQGTIFAKVIGGDRTIDITTPFGNDLPAMRLTQVDVEFEAIKNFPLSRVLEAYVKYTISADFMSSTLFAVSFSGIESTQIHPS